MVIDAGTPAGEIAKIGAQYGATVKYVVLTHGHYDHARYLTEYLEAFPDAILISHGDELRVLSDPWANVSYLFGDVRTFPTPKRTVAEGDIIRLGTSEITVLSTPGHTPGSICLYSEDDGLMLTGDTLFYKNRGRTDFRYGSDADMMHSLERLFKMDGKIVIYPGHGEAATLGDSFFLAY
jgi:glyoxylase-like metal-dependent hydrolase (beta-lactamase superfamily II)